ncbi:MAG: endospore germination permease, partial [Firmicutes bacterium]|nr:endospore germination permease [Bacillota bacterium]
SMATLDGGKISSGQFLAFLVLTRMLAALIEAPTISGTSAEHDAWIGIVLSTLLTIPWGFLLVHLGNMFPGMTIIEYSQVILGPWLGRLVGLVIIIFFLQQSAYAIRLSSAAYVTTIMPETPLLVFVAIITFLSANAARSGIEVLARASTVSFFVAMTMLIVLLILPLNIMDFGNLRPVMARGWQPVGEATLSSFAIYGELLVMTMLIPYLNRRRDAGPTVFYAILLSGFLFTWFTIAITAAFGPLMSTLIMPAFSLGRLVQFALLIERVEVVPLIGWTISVGVKQSLFMWAAMMGIAQWFNLVEVRALAYPVGALVAALSIWLFRGVFDASDFATIKRFGTLSILISVGIPLFLYIMAIVRRAIRQAVGKEG